MSKTTTTKKRCEHGFFFGQLMIKKMTKKNSKEKSNLTFKFGHTLNLKMMFFSMSKFMGKRFSFHLLTQIF